VRTVWPSNRLGETHSTVPISQLPGAGVWADQFEPTAKGDIQSTFSGSSPLRWPGRIAHAPSR
jgi:hypothetical protein